MENKNQIQATPPQNDKEVEELKEKIIEGLAHVFEEDPNKIRDFVESIEKTLPPQMNKALSSEQRKEILNHLKKSITEQPYSDNTPQDHVDEEKVDEINKSAEYNTEAADRIAQKEKILSELIMVIQEVMNTKEGELAILQKLDEIEKYI